MGLVKGPFDLRWGSNTLVDVSEISLDYSQDTTDYTTIDNRRYTVDGAISATVTVTFLASDVATLAAVLPQYYVAAGGVLSTGETVATGAGKPGAIDVVAASCDIAPVYHSLYINACGTDSESFRLVNARTKIDSMEFADNAVRTVTVAFIGEPPAGDATIQFFRENDIPTVS